MTEKETMNCAEFHKELPFLFEAGGEIRHPHLAECDNCASLVKDLRYIADQAKLLLPMHDPSPRVWNNIQASLVKDGLVATDRNTERGHTVAAQKKNNRFLTLGWAAAVAAALLIAFSFFRGSSSPASPQQTAAVSPSLDGQDQQLLAEVQERSPALRPVYESNLNNVNHYISDARATLAQDPSDDQARVHLRQAYAQKAMLYRMGTSRSFDEIPNGQ